MEFLSLKGAAQAHLSLRMSKCHIVGTLTSRLIYMGVKKNRLVYDLVENELIEFTHSYLEALDGEKASPLTVVKSKYLKPQILNLGQQSENSTFRNLALAVSGLFMA